MDTRKENLDREIHDLELELEKERDDFEKKRRKIREKQNDLRNEIRKIEEEKDSMKVRASYFEQLSQFNAESIIAFAMINKWRAATIEFPAVSKEEAEDLAARGFTVTEVYSGAEHVGYKVEW